LAKLRRTLSKGSYQEFFKGLSKSIQYRRIKRDVGLTVKPATIAGKYFVNLEKKSEITGGSLRNQV